MRPRVESDLNTDREEMLLAWDTTHRLNWGARGAHVAMSQLLEQSVDAVETLSGQYQTKSYPINYTFPDWMAYPLSRKRDELLAARVYDKVERMAGGEWDYLSEDPRETAKNILDNSEKAFFGNLLRKIEGSKKIVIDGNGDMIFKEEPTRNLRFSLALIELADYLGKEIYYVNAIFSDCPMTGRNETVMKQCVSALRTCDGVAFRDPTSLARARRVDEDLEAEWIPDSLFYWARELRDSGRQLPQNGDFLVPYPREHRSHFGRLDFEEPYICVTGGSRAAKSAEEARDGYCTLVEHLGQLDLPVYLVPTSVGDRFLYGVSEETNIPIVPAEVPILMGGALLANARLFVTGRYHPAIMAAAGGTPSVFLGADSHKTLSIQRVLEYDDPHVYSAIPDREESRAIRKRARELLNDSEGLRDRIEDAARQCARATARLPSLIDRS